MLPVTDNVVPIVALLLIVIPFTVAFPDELIEVKYASTGVIFPITVFWIPPAALNVDVTVALPKILKPLPVIFPLLVKLPPNETLLPAIKLFANMLDQ